MIATGSDAHIPTVERLDRIPLWTNGGQPRCARPRSGPVMIGRSAVGTEPGQFRPVRRPGDHPGTVGHPCWPGRTRGQRAHRRGLRADDVDVRTRVQATRIRRDRGDMLVTLDDAPPSAVILGEVARVREAVEGDLGLVTRPDARPGMDPVAPGLRVRVVVGRRASCGRRR
jgi:hypothetical protein